MIKKTIEVTHITMETYQALLELGYEVVFKQPVDKCYLFFWN